MRAHGDQIQLRGVVGGFGETRTATATAGGATARYDVVARAKDETPDAIPDFTALTVQVSGETVVSNVKQLRGHDGVTVTVTGDGAQVRSCTTPTCSGGTESGWSTTTEVAADRYVQLRTVAGSTNAPVIASLSYGASSLATWSVTSQVDTELYSFTNLARNAPSKRKHWVGIDSAPSVRTDRVCL